MTADPDLPDIVRWLSEGAPGGHDAADMLERLAEGLLEAGVPVGRAAIFVRTPHPNLIGRRYLWNAGEGVVVSEAPYSFTLGDEYKRSPVVWVTDNNRSLRRRLIDGGHEDFSVLDEFSAEGFTDYLAEPLAFMDGEIHVVTWTTRQAAGFSERDIAILQSVRAPLSRMAEIYALRRTATVLLETYVGGRTGARILAGQIKRGDRQSIDAVIMVSDLIGFTGVAETLGDDGALDLLNRYYDCLVPGIEANGGEILKFMGDSLMAIWPVEGGDRVLACRHALAACGEVLARVDEANAGGGQKIDFGIGLNLGRMTYGNIGSGNRLDFTVIGSAVNLASRIEGLCHRTGRRLLAAAPFADAAPAAMRPVGEFALRGLPGMHPVFGLESL